MVADTSRWREDEPPGIDPKRVPRRARTRVKKAEKTLRKFGVWPRRKMERTKFVEFRGGSLLEGILKSRRDIDMIYRGEVRRLLVGPDAMDPLQAELWEKVGPRSFPEKVHLMGPWGRKVFDLDVQYIPWMRGVLLVPDFEARVDEPLFSSSGAFR